MASLLILSALTLVSALPCDIYASGGTPCVAAHSTVRSLLSSYTGPLYQVTRDDGQTADITQASQQDTFCTSGCVISIIYDQSGNKNHLTQAPKGGFSGPAAGGADNLANATAAQIMLGGKTAYGVYIPPGTGYRNNQATGTATGDQPEGIYAVFDGQHYNDQCCFDYGNAETSSTDTGAGHMEAIYWGNSAATGTDAPSGPWVLADLENGLFSGAGNNNPQNTPFNVQFVTAIVKGNSGNSWAIRGGDATSGGLTTLYSGARPDGYNPMAKEGAIILGTGGDNSNGGQGTFFEGAMLSGFPSDETENAVQADIVAAGYGANAGSASSSTPVVSQPSATGTSATDASTTDTESITSTVGSDPSLTTTVSKSGPGDTTSTTDPATTVETSTGDPTATDPTSTGDSDTSVPTPTSDSTASDTGSATDTAAPTSVPDPSPTDTEPGPTNTQVSSTDPACSASTVTITVTTIITESSSSSSDSPSIVDSTSTPLSSSIVRQTSPSGSVSMTDSATDADSLTGSATTAPMTEDSSTTTMTVTVEPTSITSGEAVATSTSDASTTASNGASSSAGGASGGSSGTGSCNAAAAAARKKKRQAVTYAS